jgi:hypothetical protein
VHEGGYDSQLEWLAEFAENISRLLHDSQFRARSHDDAYSWLFHNLNFGIRLTTVARSLASAVVGAMTAT